jgi:hypothetical protein
MRKSKDAKAGEKTAEEKPPTRRRPPSKVLTE